MTARPKPTKKKSAQCSSCGGGARNVPCEYGEWAICTDCSSVHIPPLGITPANLFGAKKRIEALLKRAKLKRAKAKP